MSTKKPKTYPGATKALQYYEAALATLQETLVMIDHDTAKRIQEAWMETTPLPFPGGFPFQIAIHEAGDAFRAVKQVLDADRPLPSTKKPVLPS